MSRTINLYALTGLIPASESPYAEVARISAFCVSLSSCAHVVLQMKFTHYGRRNSQNSVFRRNASTARVSKTQAPTDFIVGYFEVSGAKDSHRVKIDFQSLHDLHKG